MIDDTPVELLWARREVTPWEQRERRFELAAFRARHAEEFGSGSAAICMRAGSEGAWYDLGKSGGVHKRGVQRCGDIGKCPQCAPVIRTERARDIEAAVEAARRCGFEVWFLTVTLPHTVADDVGELLGRMGRMWRDGWGKGSGYLTKQAIGFEGQIRVMEVTHGENGWHPHIHALIFCRRGQMDCERVVKLWRQRWKAEGIGSPWRKGVSAQIERVTRSGLGRYLGKVTMSWGAGLELARGDLKAGAGLTPAQLLELASCGEVDRTNFERWADFERGTKGVIWIRWSPGLRDKAIAWQLQAVTQHVEHVESCGKGRHCKRHVHREVLGRPLASEEKTDKDAAAGPRVEDLAASWWVPYEVHERYRLAGRLGRLVAMMFCNTAHEAGCVLVLPSDDLGYVEVPVMRGPPVVAAS